MSGDWIKMRTDLYRDPKVCLIADALMDPSGELAGYINQNMQREMTVTRNVMRNVTVGALVSVWGVLRHRGKRVEWDLAIKGCTISVVDDLADIQGFGEAMESVGWLKQAPEGIVLPRFFEEFNVDPSEDAKAKNAERQRRYREKQAEKSNGERNVTVTSKSNGREEKRREEKIEVKTNTGQRAARSAVMPPGFDPKVWTDFLAIRKAKRAPLTDTALAGISREAEKAGLGLEEAMRTCCERGWQGFNAEWLSSGAKAPDYSSLLKGD